MIGCPLPTNGGVVVAWLDLSPAKGVVDDAQPFIPGPPLPPMRPMMPSNIAVAVTFVPLTVPCTTTMSPTAMFPTVVVALFFLITALVASTVYVVVAVAVGPKP